MGNSTVHFALDTVAGSRSAIRLLNSACGWAEAIAGKTNFVFLGLALDTAALSKNWLKPLDNEIYVVKGVKGLLTFKDKCWNKLDKNETATVLRACQHFTKTISDSAAGLRCLAGFGFVILTPYAKRLSLTKNVLAVTAGFFEIACSSLDLWKVANTKVKTEEEQKALNVRWSSDVLMIIIQVFSIQLNLFGGLDTAFGSQMDSRDRLPGTVFNFWGTSASFLGLGLSAVKYFGSDN